MKKLIAAVAALTLVGCPKPAPADPVFVGYYPGIWTSWPPPFEYTEVGAVAAQGWTLQLAQAAAVEQAEDVGGVGVARAKWSVRFVSLPPDQCEVTPGCKDGGKVIDEDFGETYQAAGMAAIWTVTGAVVGVWHPPEAHDAAPVESPPASP